MKALSFQQLLDGYEKTIVTGHRLLMSAMVLLKEFPEVSLGLSELGQEEIGKSLSFLAAFSFDADEAQWDWFWAAWKNHQMKAHRAYLYELFSPVRIDTMHQDGTPISGPTLRSKIHHEKEWSFYVNFDPKTGLFHSPEDSVSIAECANRVLTLLYLATTARSVALGLKKNEAHFAYRALSEIALRICSTNVFQQDMKALFKEFEGRSKKHSDLVSSIRESLAEGRRSLYEIHGQKVPDTEDLEYP